MSLNIAHRGRPIRPLAVAVISGAVFGLLAAGCATWAGVKTEHREDGTVELRCGTSLARCLDHAEDVCFGAGYEVLRAVDSHDYFGPSNVALQTEKRSSEAVVRCGSRGKLLFGGGGGNADKAAAPPAAPVRACVPGSTQACVGVGACAGGQACLPDGSGYGPCACAGAPPASAATTAAPDPDAGTRP